MSFFCLLVYQQGFEPRDGTRRKEIDPEWSILAKRAGETRPSRKPAKQAANPSYKDEICMKSLISLQKTFLSERILFLKRIPLLIFYSLIIKLSEKTTRISEGSVHLHINITFIAVHSTFTLKSSFLYGK